MYTEIDNFFIEAFKTNEYPGRIFCNVFWPAKGPRCFTYKASVKELTETGALESKTGARVLIPREKIEMIIEESQRMGYWDV